MIRNLESLHVEAQKNMLLSIWDEMEVLYGRTFGRKYGPPIKGGSLTRVGLGWFTNIRKFTPNAIRRAIDACKDRHPTSAPTLPQFIQLCKAFQPRDKVTFAGIKKRPCDYHDDRGQCQNEGTISNGTSGEGPWRCMHHHRFGNG